MFPSSSSSSSPSLLLPSSTSCILPPCTVRSRATPQTLVRQPTEKALDEFSFAFHLTPGHSALRLRPRRRPFLPGVRQNRRRHRRRYRRRRRPGGAASLCRLPLLRPQPAGKGKGTHRPSHTGAGGGSTSAGLERGKRDGLGQSGGMKKNRCEM
jgi:hypothetical protein